MKIKFTLALMSFFLFTHLSAQEITEFPGIFGTKYYQDDTRIERSEVGELMKIDTETNRLWQKSNTHRTIAYSCYAVQLGFLTWQLTQKYREDQVIPLIGNIVVGSVGLGFMLSSNKLRKNAILRYNNNLPESIAIQLGPTYNGYGLVVSF